jgi:hypothetical protein
MIISCERVQKRERLQCIRNRKRRQQQRCRKTTAYHAYHAAYRDCRTRARVTQHMIGVDVCHPTRRRNWCFVSGPWASAIRIASCKRRTDLRARGPHRAPHPTQRTHAIWGLLPRVGCFHTTNCYVVPIDARDDGLGVVSRGRGLPLSVLQFASAALTSAPGVRILLFLPDHTLTHFLPYA